MKNGFLKDFGQFHVFLIFESNKITIPLPDGMNYPYLIFAIFMTLNLLENILC